MVTRRASACAEDVPRQGMECSQRHYEGSVREQETGEEVSEADSVRGSQEDGEEREKRRIALVSGNQQVAIGSDHAVPPPVPGSEQSEEMMRMPRRSHVAVAGQHLDEQDGRDHDETA